MKRKGLTSTRTMHKLRIMKSRSELVTSVEAAELLGIDRFQVIRLHHRGKLRAHMRAPGRNGALFFRRRDVERMKSAA